MQSVIKKTLSQTTRAVNKFRNQTSLFSSEVASPIATDDMEFHHFRVKDKKGTSGRKKFENPRKRANKMFAQIQQEAMDTAKDNRPNVHNVKFRVGDSIELTMIAQGGVDSAQTEKIRGVVLGMDKRGLGTGFYLRDVVFGEPIDRKIPLYSPLIKDIKLLEQNFVFKKKRKVKRAKLYYLRDRAPQGKLFHIEIILVCRIGLHLTNKLFSRNSGYKVVKYSINSCISRKFDKQNYALFLRIKIKNILPMRETTLHYTSQQ